jgi:hypothetical protein
MGNWTSFGLLGVAAAIVVFLWYMLGSSSEYKGSDSLIDITEVDQRSAVDEEKEKKNSVV